MPLNILVTFILCLMFLDGKLNRIEGGILFAGMILYITVMIYHAIKNKSENEPEKILSLPRSIIYMIAGLAAVIFGGDLVVDKACIIATNFGVSQNFIGLTIVAIGTSLPETGNLHCCHQKKEIAVLHSEMLSALTCLTSCLSLGSQPSFHHCTY